MNALHNELYFVPPDRMIRRFRVSNFKSLAGVSVDLEPVTVIVGRSGAGKSNFVNAIRFLRDFLTLGMNAVNAADGAKRFLCATSVPQDGKIERLEFEVIFVVPAVAEEFHYSLSLAFRTRNQLMSYDESLSVGGRSIFRHSNGKWLVEPPVVGLPRPDGIMLDKLNGIEEVGIAYQMLVNGIGCYDFSADVLRSTNNRSNIVAPRGLADDAANYLAAFETIASDLQNMDARREILAAVKELNSTVKSMDVEKPNRSQMIIAHQVANGLLPLSLSDESEGLRRFLAHLLALYQKPSKQCLVFEEPEKGIYPAALAVLADQFKACAESGRGQVILTTHSPQLLDHFAPESLRVVEMNSSLETRIGKVAHDQVEAIRERLLSSGELLTVDSPRLNGTEERVVHSQ